MKLAVAGKGGVGKTTLAGTLARLLSKDGYRVIAVDADPSMNLASALGIGQQDVKNLTPISENSELIEQRTGARPGASGSIFSLTPKVDDLVELYGIKGPDDVTLVVMGTVKSAGSGCMCPANSLLKALLRHLFLERKDAIVIDMEAGIEHLGRGTVRGVDCVLDVVEPSVRALETASRIKDLAYELGIKRVLAVINKLRNSDEEGFVVSGLKERGIEVLGSIPYDEKVVEADMKGKALIDHSPSSQALEAIKKLKEGLEKAFGQGAYV